MSFHKEGKKSEFQNKTKEYRSIFVGNENGTQFCFFFFFFVFVEVFGTLMNRGEMRFLWDVKETVVPVDRWNRFDDFKMKI